MPSPKSGKAGSAVWPKAPGTPYEADTADPGEVEKYKAEQRKTQSGKYGSSKVAPYKPGQTDEEKKKQDNNKNKPKEPSEYAKKLKAQAEALSAQFKFREAQDLTLEGAKKDPSVMHYGDFIERLKNVVTINKK
jgi:hypothetical protein